MRDYRFKIGQVVKVKGQAHYFKIINRWQEGDTVKDTIAVYDVEGPVNLAMINNDYCGGVAQKHILPLSRKETGVPKYKVVKV